MACLLWDLIFGSWWGLRRFLAKGRDVGIYCRINLERLPGLYIFSYADKKEGSVSSVSGSIFEPWKDLMVIWETRWM